MVSLQASKTLFSLVIVNHAPLPAPRMSNKVTYFHGERQQLQSYCIAELDSSVELFRDV